MLALTVISCVILPLLLNIKRERGGKQEGKRRERERGKRGIGRDGGGVRGEFGMVSS